jgi:hypothetical protein
MVYSNSDVAESSPLELANDYFKNGQLTTDGH